MKPTTTRFALLSLGAAFPHLSTPVLAIDQTYDDANVSNVWDLSTTNWDASAAVWTNGNSAIFGGTGEPVDNDAALTAGNLTFNSNNYSIIDATNNGTLTLVGTPSLLAVTNSADTATISEILAGSGGITKNGSGTLRLNGVNTFTGLATVSTGVLQLGNAAAMGVGGNNAAFQTGNISTVSSGATLQLITGIAPNNEHLTLVGDGAAGAATPAGHATLGALYAVPNAASSNTRWGLSSFNASGVSGNSNATFPAITLAGSTTVRVDGTIASSKVLLGYVAGAGMTLNKTGTGGIGFDRGANIGTINLLEGSVAPNAANAFTWGTVNVSAGALWENQQNLTFNSATIALTVNGTYDLNSRTAGGDVYTQNIGTLSGNGTISNGTIGSSTATGAQTLNVNSATADSVFDGVITRNAGGTVNLGKGGAGTRLTLNGNNNYPGTTTVNAGILQVGSGGVTGTLGQGNVTVASGAELVINRSGAMTATGSLLGGGTVTKEGSGTASFTGPFSSFAGVTAVNGGKLFVKNASSYGTTGSGNVTIAAGASFGASGTMAGTIIAPGGATPATAATIDLSNTETETLIINDLTPLTAGNATAGEATYLTVEAGATAADKLALDGDLVVEQGGLKIQVNSIGIAAGQTYDLVTFNAASGAGFATGSGTTVGSIELVNPSISFGVTGSLTVTATGIQLVTSGAAAPAAAYWSGSKGSMWTSTGSGQGNFTTTAAGGTFLASLPGAATAVFFSNNSPANLTHTLGANFAIDSLTFRGASAAVSIGGGEQLSIQGGGITLESGNGGATLGMATLALGASQTWTNGSANPLVVTSAVSGSLSDLTLSGNSIVLGGSSFTTASLAVDAALDLAGTSITTDAFSGGGSVTNSGAPATMNLALNFDGEFSGTLSDAGAGSAVSLVKTGAGQLTLSGANSHNGVVTINGGIVKLGNASALGAPGVQTAINNGGALDLAGQTLSEALTVIGAGSFSAGALTNSDTVNPATVAYEIENGAAFSIGGDGNITLQRARFFGPTIVSAVGTGTVTLGNASTTTHFNLMALSHTSAGTVNLGLSGSDSIVCDRGLRVTGGGTVRMTGTSNRMLVENCEVILSDGTLDLNGDSLLGQDNAIGGNGGAGRVTLGDGTTNGVIAGGATCVLELHTASGTFASNTAGTPGFEARSGSVDVVLAGAVSVPFNKTTAGNVSLLQNNALLGKTTVTEGTLTMAHACLADTADLEITTTVGAGGILDLTHGQADVVAGLIIDGVPVAVDGSTYGGAGSGADHIVSYITGSGKIQVGAAGGYASWAASKGLTAGVNDGINDDPDFDGIANLLEYVLGGLPIGAGASDTSILPDQSLTTTDIVLAFRRSDLSESDTTVKVQWSTDLATWGAPNEVAVGETSAGIVTVTEDSPTAELDTVSVAVPRSNAAGGKLFVRVIATQP